MKIFEKLNKRFIQLLPLMYENISNGFPELPSKVFRKRIDTTQFAYPVSTVTTGERIVNHIDEFTYADDIILDDKQSDTQSFYRALHVSHYTDEFNKSVYKHIKDKDPITTKYHRLWVFSPINIHKSITSDSIDLIYMPYHIWNRPLQFRSIYEMGEVKHKHHEDIEEEEEPVNEVF